MRVLAIGDVGVTDDMIHIGDEAMFEEFATRVRSLGVDDLTALSAAPAETAERYGVDAVPNIGFAPAVVGGRDGQVDRLARVLAAAEGDRSGLARDDSAWAVIEAARASDGVAVSGGGNMASIWPLHIFERAAVAGIASRFGKPFVVSGQTIGPELVGLDRDLVRTLLSSARLVGLRERASYDLVRELGVDPALLEATIDDASFVGAGPVSTPAPAARPYCAVTLANHVGGLDTDAFATSVAALLDRVADETGLEIVFHAHFASLDPAVEAGDSVVHRRVIDRMTTTSVRIEPTTDSVASARFSRGASLVLSSRYHPAVFAVSAGVPTVGIAVDDYTTVKLTGALGNLGQTAVVSAREVVDGVATARVVATWGDRGAIHEAWAGRIDGVRAASDAWWQRVAGALGA